MIFNTLCYRPFQQALLLLSLVAFQPAMAQKKADLILLNARVHTLNPSQDIEEAIAVSGDKIVFVGSNKEAIRLKSRNTQLIDANGRTVIPGLFDAHLHVIRAGRFYNAELRWDGVKSLARALNMLQEQAKRTPEGQWVRVVGGWNAFQFEEKRLPTLEEINAATGNVPTFILHLYGHAYVNKAGMRLLNIGPETPSPTGGLIEKDEQGQPTGLLVAEPNAYLLYSTLAKLPELSPEERVNSTLGFIRELNRLGITSAMDAGGGFQNYPEDYTTTALLCDSGQLNIRIPYYLFAQKAGKEKDDFNRWISSVSVGESCNNDDRVLDYIVQGAGENLVATAADFENFDQPRPELNQSMETQLKEVLQLLISNRWPFRLHATYDQSITRFLNVLEEVNTTTPLNGLVWFFDHAETISAANLERVKKLGGGIAIQHRMAYQGESFIRRYGLPAAQQSPPIQKMLAMGIPVGMGSDGTRVSSFNPWIGLYWLTTGKTVGGIRHLSPDNTLDRTTALRLFTQGSASLVRLESTRGTIATGMLADFIILNQDYFSVPENQIESTVSECTIVGGKVVYASGTFAHFAPAAEEVIPGWSPVKFYGGYQNK